MHADVARACLLWSRPFLKVSERVVDGLDKKSQLKTTKMNNIDLYQNGQKINNLTKSHA